MGVLFYRLAHGKIREISLEWIFPARQEIYRTSEPIYEFWRAEYLKRSLSEEFVLSLFLRITGLLFVWNFVGKKYGIFSKYSFIFCLNLDMMFLFYNFLRLL